MSQNRVRIIGGRWKRRWLRFPPVEGLRPTPDRVRETLFNWLGQDLEGLVCLDLFAGSGALGLEAASRGAREVVLLERNRRIADALKATVLLLQPDHAAIEIVRSDALEFLAHDRRIYDVVFLDPPYAFWQRSLHGLNVLLSRLAKRIAPRARVYLEASDFPELPLGWRSVKRDRAGFVHYQLLEAEVQ